MNKLIDKINQLSIRAKLVLLNSIAFGIISAFLVLFIPPRIEKHLMEGVNLKAESIISMVSSSIRPALYFGDIMEGTYVINSAKLIPDIAYIVVNNVDGSEFVSYNQDEAVRYNHLNSDTIGFAKYDDVIKTKKAIIENNKVIGYIYIGLSLKSPEETIQASRIIIAISSAIIFIFFFFATSSISKVVMAPLVSIVDTIEKISKGNRNLRAELHSQKEIYQLANTFNEMLDNLNLAYEDLQTTKEELESRVVERTRVLRQLNESLQNEITVRKKVERVTEALYTISKAQTSTQKLDTLFEIIHTAIGTVFNNRNFFIAKYEKEQDIITFPFFKDEYNLPKTIHNASLTNSLCVEVILKGKSLLFNHEQLKEIWAWDQQKNKGHLSRVWMGIPLKIKDDIIGAMVLQSYDNTNEYCEADIEIAESFAEQVALAMHQKKAEEEINLLAHAVESSNELVIITDNSSNLIYANKAFNDAIKNLNKITIGNNNEVLTSENKKEIINKFVSKTSEGNWQGEIVIHHKDGTELPIFLSASPVLDENNTPIAFIAVATNMSDIKHALNAIRESEEKFKHLFEYNPIPMYVRDQATTQFVEVNDAMARHYGYSKEEFLEMNLTDVFVDENVHDYIEKIKMASIGDKYFIQGKSRIKNGSLIDVEFTTHIINYSGMPAVLTAVVDVTSRLKAQAQIQNSLIEKETLLKEIHHRVKNNLQVISSLLNLQSKKIKDSYDLTLFNESQDRVKSMAMIHEMLYRSKDLGKIDFADYLRKLTSSLMRSYNLKRNVSFKMEVRDIFLDIDTAVPCGLIINELVTNSLKYAFPDSKPGYISIKVEQLEKMTILVEDNGIGLPEHINFEKIESLGLKLVKILIDQLQGSLEIVRNGGTKFIITLK